MLFIQNNLKIIQKNKRFKVKENNNYYLIF